MKIFYDYQILFSQQRGGISRYFFELYSTILKQFSNTKINLSIFFSKNLYFVKVIPFRKLLPKGSWIVNEFYCFFDLLFHKYDIIHPTDYNPCYMMSFPFVKKKSKLVVTVHDMTHEILITDEVNFINKKKKLIDMADGIITVSKQTKKDLIKIYPNLANKKIKVIYHGNSLENIHAITPIELPNKYIIYVGHRLGYKNFFNLAKAVAKLEHKISVLCVGGGDFTEEEKKLFHELRIENLMLQKGLTDSELLYAYTNAECLVFPSLYEGFGMPILEAFGAGCPVILSDKSCFPEIAKDAALYFSNDNVIELTQKIELILSDKQLKKELILLGKERVKDFSWEKAAIQTYEFYEEILMGV